MTTKISPDERITMNALENSDPFARNGVPTQPLNQPKVAKKPGRKPKEDVTEQVDGSNETKPLETIENAVMSEESIQVSDKTEEEPHKTLPVEQPIVESRSIEGLPSYRTEFAGKDIFIGFSSRKATNPVTAFALWNIALDFGKDKIRFDFSNDEDNFYQSRNTLAKKFLETDAKWLVLIDNDIIPSIGRPAWSKSHIGAARNVQDLALQRHIIHRLIGSGKTLVGGAYFANTEATSIVCSNKELGSKAKSYPDSIEQVDWIGSGCLLIHRRVLTDILAKFPDMKHGIFYPDDISFCKKAKDSGHQAHIDLGIPVFNVGVKAF